MLTHIQGTYGFADQMTGENFAESAVIIRMDIVK